MTRYSRRPHWLTRSPSTVSADTRIAPDVPQLALVGEGADDDLAVLEPDPGRADVRPTVAVERHERRDGCGFDERECLVGQEIGHRRQA